MTNSNIEKLSPLRNFVCHHSNFANALASIEECMQISYMNKQPIGSLLLGEGGVGKSTICRLIKSKYKPYKHIDNNFEKLIVPAFYFPVPSPITIKSLAIRMLEELGCLDQTGTSEQINYRLRILLKECETKLIMLDEFHHIYNSNAQKNKTSESVANWIKTLADETKISICLVGLPNIQDNLFFDTQLARRFSHVIKLKPLILNESIEQSTLTPFLKQVSNFLSKKLWLTFEPEIYSPNLAKCIFLATSGYQAYVMQLIYHSCLNAMNSNRSTVAITDFYEAYANKGLIYKPMTSKDIFLFHSI